MNSNPPHLEPNQIIRVIDHAHLVRLGIPHPHPRLGITPLNQLLNITHPTTVPRYWTASPNRRSISALIPMSRSSGSISGRSAPISRSVASSTSVGRFVTSASCAYGALPNPPIAQSNRRHPASYTARIFAAASSAAHADAPQSPTHHAHPSPAASHRATAQPTPPPPYPTSSPAHPRIHQQVHRAHHLIDVPSVSKRIPKRHRHIRHHILPALYASSQSAPTGPAPPPESAAGSGPETAAKSSKERNRRYPPTLHRALGPLAFATSPIISTPQAHPDTPAPVPNRHLRKRLLRHKTNRIDMRKPRRNQPRKYSAFTSGFITFGKLCQASRGLSIILTNLGSSSVHKHTPSAPISSSSVLTVSTGNVQQSDLSAAHGDR